MLNSVTSSDIGQNAVGKYHFARHYRSISRGFSLHSCYHLPSAPTRPVQYL